MKFAAFVLLSCMCICLANSKGIKEQTWGNVYGNVFGTQNIVVESAMLTVRTHTFTYPKVGSHCFVTLNISKVVIIPYQLVRLNKKKLKTFNNVQ